MTDLHCDKRTILYGKLAAEGLAPYYIKFPQRAEKGGNKPLFHIHIDAQAPIPEPYVCALEKKGFFADDFDHDFRLMGAGGDPGKAFPHNEPINHMTFKTGDPEKYYAAWKEARKILHRATCLAAEIGISDAVRSNDETTADAGRALHGIMPYLKKRFFRWNEKGFYSFTPANSKAEQDLDLMAALKHTSLQDVAMKFRKLGLISEKEPIGSWNDIARNIGTPTPHVYYLEGELIPFDRTLTPVHGAGFNDQAFETFFPKAKAGEENGKDILSFTWEPGIRRHSIFAGLSKRQLNGPASPENGGKEELARNKEVHISMIAEKTDPRLLEIMGHLGYSAPSIPKYTATKGGQDIKRNAEGAPILLHELPFTVQTLNCRKFDSMVNATVTMIEQVGGFRKDAVSVKVEPVLTFEITKGLDYSRHMPPVLNTVTIRPDIAKQLEYGKIGKNIDLRAARLPHGFSDRLRAARIKFTQESNESRKSVADQSFTDLVVNKTVPPATQKSGPRALALN